MAQIAQKEKKRTKGYKEGYKGFYSIIKFLNKMKSQGCDIEYEYNRFAKDIYGKIDGRKFSIGGITLTNSEDARIIKYLVVIYTTRNPHNNNNKKYTVRTQEEVIRLLRKCL